MGSRAAGVQAGRVGCFAVRGGRSRSHPMPALAVLSASSVRCRYSCRQAWQLALYPGSDTGTAHIHTHGNHKQLPSLTSQTCGDLASLPTSSRSLS